MRPIIKFMLWSTVVFVCTSVLPPPASAQQSGTAVEDRREREWQRGAMRRDEDFQRRQSALRMLVDKQAGRRDEPTKT